MSETEKDLSADKLTADAEPAAKPAGQGDDDNVSWEDAFEEQNAASPAVEPAGPAGRDKVNEPDLNTGDVKNKQDTMDAAPAPPAAKAVKRPVKKLEFSSFDESDKTTEAPKNLDFILDIPLTISVELGRTKMLINDMLQLGQGSVIELSKLAGEPLDIYVNGKLMARGEVVLVNDKFGVRLTDIISPVERVKKL